MVFNGCVLLYGTTITEGILLTYSISDRFLRDRLLQRKVESSEWPLFKTMGGPAPLDCWYASMSFSTYQCNAKLENIFSAFRLQSHTVIAFFMANLVSLFLHSILSWERKTYLKLFVCSYSVTSICAWSLCMSVIKLLGDKKRPRKMEIRSQTNEYKKIRSHWIFLKISIALDKHTHTHQYYLMVFLFSSSKNM